MKRPVAKISNLSRRLATFASDVIDHSRRSPTFASRCFALLRVQSKRTLTLTYCILSFFFQNSCDDAPKHMMMSRYYCISYFAVLLHSDIYQLRYLPTVQKLGMLCRIRNVQNLRIVFFHLRTEKRMRFTYVKNV